MYTPCVHEVPSIWHSLEFASSVVLLRMSSFPRSTDTPKCLAYLCSTCVMSNTSGTLLYVCPSSIVLGGNLFIFYKKILLILDRFL
jgi:hypothetical protein